MCWLFFTLDSEQLIINQTNNIKIKNITIIFIITINLNTKNLVNIIFIIFTLKSFVFNYKFKKIINSSLLYIMYFKLWYYKFYNINIKINLLKNHLKA
jgi:hypothetical protein